MKMTNIRPVVEPEEMLPQVEKMIYKQAWTYSQRYPITFEEAKAEAYFAFVSACYDYKPERGQKFSTWCYYWIWTKLKDLITKRSTDPLILTEINDDLCGCDEVSDDFKHLLEELRHDLSDRANEILNLLVNVPQELIAGDRPPTPRQLMLRTKKFLIDQGHTKEDVDAAHTELDIHMRWALA